MIFKCNQIFMGSFAIGMGAIPWGPNVGGTCRAWMYTSSIRKIFFTLRLKEDTLMIGVNYIL